ncbi:MAG: calcium/sodium antiporter [Candidatus Methanoplasma sp.]|jgi:cation:H+ antiporter|nr:calcium/sodium antiporter [Candidatus Methanoplasma sp.]
MSWLLLGIPIGIVLLYFGSEWTVGGAKKLAIRLGVAPFVIGLTVVAFGSSSPELVTTLVSENNPQIIVGNIVGSNILNVGLSLALAALITPIICSYKAIRFELIAMVVAVVAVTVLSLSGVLGWMEGIILLVALCVFVCLVYFLKKISGETDDPEVDPTERASLPKCIVLVAVGIVALYLGARAFIGGSVELAEMMGVSELLIGLIIVAVGTGLPETCISLVGAYRHENELVVSNIVGSIVFNSFFALGVGILFTSVEITHYMMVFHMPVMIIFAVLLALIIRSGSRVTRGEGAVLLVMYAAYIGAMIMMPELTQGFV